MDIGEMQRRLSVKASKEPGHKFGDLFHLICRTDWLLQAHDHVASNAGSKTAGCDGITMGDFDQDLDRRIQVLREDLKGGTFQPHPVRRAHIPKGEGKVRPLGIPSIRDRIVQEALRMALEPIFEADFCQESYGFRPDRRTMDAIAHLKVYTMETVKYFWVIEGDIKSYFDTINHRRLMKLLGRRIEDRKALRLIRDFLRAKVMERKQLKDTPTGAPQGGVISPLLANVYLHELDKFMLKYAGLAREEKTNRRKEGLGNFAYARYADDCAPGNVCSR
jgi:RNA-directed DNA polymerase